MRSSASVQMCTNAVSSTGPSSLKTMRLLSSNWLAEQLSTRRAHPVIMNSRALLFQVSNTTVLVSEIKDCTTFRVQDELSSNDSTSLINILVVLTILLVLTLQCISDVSSLSMSSFVQMQQEHLDFRPEMKTIFNILACR